MLFRMLEAKGIPTHYVKELSDTETLVKKVKIVPLEVIVRNVAAGSLSKRIGYPEGASLLCPVLEFSYKNDELGDPMINDYHALAMGIATEEDLRKIKDMARLQTRVRHIPRRDNPCGRDFSRHMQVLGFHHSREARQGPFPQRYGRSGRRVSGSNETFARKTGITELT